MTEPKPSVASMPEPTAPAVAYAVADAVATLTLSNPLRLNAMTAAMWAAIPPHMATAEADPSVRVIVVRGAGQRAFSAGADISEFAESRTGPAAAHYNDLNHAAFAALEGASKPTVAMIHGPCLGGGLAIAACCDLRWADTAAQFSIPAAKLGIGYDPRWIRPLLRILSPPHVKELLFTARRLTAADALSIGLVNRLAAPDALADSVAALGADIASNAPLTLRAAKASIDALARQPERTDLSSLDALVATCFKSDDYAEGCRAFMEKRKPVFGGR